MKVDDKKASTSRFELSVNGEEWRHIDNLKDSVPNDPVFSFDAKTGVVTFGDGIHGRRPPAGNANIRATYKYGGGVAGAVDDEMTLSLTAKSFGEYEAVGIKIERGVNGIVFRAYRETEPSFANKWVTVLCSSIKKVLPRLRCRSR